MLATNRRPSAIAALRVIQKAGASIGRREQNSKAARCRSIGASAFKRLNGFPGVPLQKKDKADNFPIYRRQIGIEFQGRLNCHSRFGMIAGEQLNVSHRNLGFRVSGAECDSLFSRGDCIFVAAINDLHHAENGIWG